jgi:hypothetical protein
MDNLHLLQLDKNEPLPRILSSHQSQLFGIAPVHQPLAFRLPNALATAIGRDIYQSVKAALLANGIRYHK